MERLNIDNLKNISIRKSEIINLWNGHISNTTEIIDNLTGEIIDNCNGVNNPKQILVSFLADVIKDRDDKRLYDVPVHHKISDYDKKKLEKSLEKEELDTFAEVEDQGRNLSKELCHILGIEPIKVYPPQDEMFGSYEDCVESFDEVYVNFIQDENFEKLKSIFDKGWSTPFKFVEKEDTYDNLVIDYWAHQSKENYISYLIYALPRLLQSSLRKVIEQAQKIEWRY